MNRRREHAQTRPAECRRARAAGVLPLAVLLLALAAVSQQSGPPTLLPPMHVTFGQSRLPQSMLDRMARQRARRNQAKIRQETRQLLRLSEQVQKQLARAGNGVLPAAVLKQLAAIEKLAHKIRDRLRDGGR